MSILDDWCIPPSVLQWAQKVPTHVAVAVLMRHSIRPELQPGDVGYGLRITHAGARLAEELGRVLGPRIRSLHTSPVLRCIETVEHLRTGAGIRLDIAQDRLLGDPGVFVLDENLALPNWQALGNDGVIAHLLGNDQALPGMARPDHAARFLVQHMFARMASEAGLHIFMTHDSLVAATVGRTLCKRLVTDFCPWYLESAFFWRDQTVCHAAFREMLGSWRYDNPCGLSESDVIEFARREVGAVAGLALDARFSMIGRSFCALLSGTSTRELDLWAASATDYERLVAGIERRGGRRVQTERDADVFESRDRLVRVRNDTRADNLETLLERSDIALSAVGAAYFPSDRWQAIVHPLAQESVKRREVLLLRPLAGCEGDVETTRDLYRYAQELGYSIPESNVAAPSVLRPSSGSDCHPD